MWLIRKSVKMFENHKNLTITTIDRISVLNKLEGSRPNHCPYGIYKTA
jgi:hypothetical protein